MAQMTLNGECLAGLSEGILHSQLSAKQRSVKVNSICRDEELELFCPKDFHAICGIEVCIDCDKSAESCRVKRSIDYAESLGVVNSE